jgi:phosphatidate cytidylyltransferase
VAAVAAVMSMIGDLAASALKREHGIKDYGRLIPGHGGIMDRFDSILMTAPATFILCMLLVK